MKHCWECDHDSYCPSYSDPEITPENYNWIKNKEVHFVGTARISENDSTNSRNESR